MSVILYEQDSYLRVQITDLTQQNEKYQQELHELRLKLQLSTNMERDLKESNESLSDNLTKALSEVHELREANEKHSAQKVLYKQQINELEIELCTQSKDNEKLREKIEEIKETKVIQPALCDSSFLDENISLKQQVRDLTEQLNKQELSEADLLLEHQQLQASVKDLQDRLHETNEILKVTKEELQAKSLALEGARNDLAMCRGELSSLKATSTGDSGKGNSIFAEVEDRRQKNLQKMAALYKSYHEMKRTYEAKEAEIKALKAEKAALHRELEDSTVEELQETGELMKKYKNRILELEGQLKEQRKKTNQALKAAEQPVDITYSYLQNLLASKQKELEELESKLEDRSIQRLIDEEAKREMGKQLRYWRHKAMSTQAQLEVVESQFKSNSTALKPDIVTPSGHGAEVEANELLDFRTTENGDTFSVGNASSKLTPADSSTRKNTLDCTNSDQAKDCEKKNVRFTSDTADEPSGPLVREPQKSYPVLLVPGKSKSK